MDRSRMYKNAGKDEELRRRRTDQSVELRKAKKEQQLQKRRNILVELEEASPIKNDESKSSEKVDYDTIVSQMGSADESLAHSATQKCRKILSRLKNPPIQDFFARGAHKVLVRLLSCHNNDVVFEASWALTNIASGESQFTKGVVEAQAVPKLIGLLDHEDVRIAEQCTWALGNIAGDGAQFRDLLLNSGIIEPSLRLLQRTWNSPNVVSNIAWMMSNLCRNKDPAPALHTVRQLLPAFLKLLDYPLNQDVSVDITWALSYISDCGEAYISDITNSGCVPLLIRNLGSENASMVSPALRAIGNLILGTDEQTQVIVDAGVLSYIPKLLNAEKSSIVKETCWLLSNITAGNLTQIQAVIDSGVIPKVISLMQEGEFRIQKEALWVVSNIIIGGSPEHTAMLLNIGVLSALTTMLQLADARTLKLAIDTFTKIFETAEEYNQLEQCCIALENCGALAYLERLQDHHNDEVYRAAYNFIATYFNDGDEDGEGEHQAEPAQNAVADESRKSTEFHFKVPDTQPGSSNFDF